jgi:carbohydrate diacid regulator
MDENGYIVASGDPDRINKIHEGAVRVVTTKQAYVIDEEEAVVLKGTKPGVNLPIEFHNKIVGVVGVTGNPKDLFKFTNVIKMTVEVLLEQVDLNQQLIYKKQMMENWILDLIHPHDIDLVKLEEIATHYLKLQLGEKVSILVLEMDLDTAELIKMNSVQAYSEYLQELERCVPYPIAFSAYLENGAFIIGMQTNGAGAGYEQELIASQRIASYLKQRHYSCYIGIGKRYSGIIGYRKSYMQAKQSLQLFKKVRLFQLKETSDNFSISHISEWGIIRMLDTLQAELMEDIMEEYIPLFTSLNSELRSTLGVFLHYDLSIHEAASHLHIHRNTLIYRLEKIHDLLHLDPRKFKDAMVLKILFLQSLLN